MPICNGVGDNGDHCCYINGRVCEFLVYADDAPRCGLWAIEMLRSREWLEAPVGRWFAAHHPGFDCHDWPQKIPAVMAAGVGLCCWGSR